MGEKKRVIFQNQFYFFALKKVVLSSFSAWMQRDEYLVRKSGCDLVLDLRSLPSFLRYAKPLLLWILILEKTNRELKNRELRFLKPGFHTSDFVQWHKSMSSPLRRCFGRRSCCNCQIKSRGFRINCQHQRQPYQELVPSSQRSLLCSLGLLLRTTINLAVFATETSPSQDTGLATIRVSPWGASLLGGGTEGSLTPRGLLPGAGPGRWLIRSSAVSRVLLSVRLGGLATK